MFSGSIRSNSQLWQSLSRPIKIPVRLGEPFRSPRLVALTEVAGPCGLRSLLPGSLQPRWRLSPCASASQASCRFWKDNGLALVERVFYRWGLVYTPLKCKAKRSGAKAHSNISCDWSEFALLSLPFNIQFYRRRSELRLILATSFWEPSLCL